eukprot:3887758-Amphidinium_carterae.1
MSEKRCSQSQCCWQRIVLALHGAIGAYLSVLARRTGVIASKDLQRLISEAVNLPHAVSMFADIVAH